MPVPLPPAPDRDAWQVAIWNAADDELSRPQKLQLMTMLEAGFNAFDPFPVVRDLLAHRPLWEAVVMTRGFPTQVADGRLKGHWHLHDDLISLRDLAGGHWNVDTVYLLHDGEHSDAVRRLTDGWHADEVDLVDPDAVGPLLGAWVQGNTQAILRAWWD